MEKSPTQQACRPGAPLSGRLRPAKSPHGWYRDPAVGAPMKHDSGPSDAHPSTCLLRAAKQRPRCLQVDVHLIESAGSEVTSKLRAGKICSAFSCFFISPHVSALFCIFWLCIFYEGAIALCMCGGYGAGVVIGNSEDVDDARGAGRRPWPFGW